MILHGLDSNLERKIESISENKRTLKLAEKRTEKCQSFTVYALLMRFHSWFQVMVGTAGALAIVSQHIQLDLRHKMRAEKAYKALIETPSLNLSSKIYYFLKLTVNKNL